MRDDATLYLATVPALRAAIARTHAAIGCLLLIGHNPGLSELATLLDAEGAGVALATGACVRFELLAGRLVAAMTGAVRAR